MIKKRDTQLAFTDCCYAECSQADFLLFVCCGNVLLTEEFIATSKSPCNPSSKSCRSGCFSYYNIPFLALNSNDQVAANILFIIHQCSGQGLNAKGILVSWMPLSLRDGAQRCMKIWQPFYQLIYYTIPCKPMYVIKQQFFLSVITAMTTSPIQQVFW